MQTGSNNRMDENIYDNVFNTQHVLDAREQMISNNQDNAFDMFGERVRRSEKPDQLPFYLHTGIVNECCANSCSYYQMISYCKTPETKEETIIAA